MTSEGSVHPPRTEPPRRGLSTGVIIGGFVLAFVSCACGFGGGLLVGFLAHGERTESEPVSPRAVDWPVAPAGPVDDLPAVDRHVPRHSASLLDGCTDEDLRMVLVSIDAAIQIGAPTYNHGDFAGCYEIYRTTAEQIEARLSPRCTGPASALAQGRERAASLGDSAARAWAMRDAFDGLIDVIESSPGG